MARPELEVKRKKYITLRATPLEKKYIERMAKDAGVSVSDWLRKCAMNKTVHKRFSEEELQHYRILHKYHKNFTSIANLFRGTKGVSKEMLQEVEEVTKQIKEELKRFQK